MIQDYNAFPIDSTVGLIIKPEDIQVMKKERTANTFEGEIDGENKVWMLGADFECNVPAGLSKGDKVKVSVPFNKVDLQDYSEDAAQEGQVDFILYKGNHYHLTIKTKSGEKVFVDTNEVWDKNDIVGIAIKPEDMTIVKA